MAFRLNYSAEAYIIFVSMSQVERFCWSRKHGLGCIDRENQIYYQIYINDPCVYAAQTKF